jgi:hypothetical protein
MTTVTRVDYPTYYELQDENGLPHSPDNDTPALVSKVMDYKAHYHHGLFHRLNDLPAIEAEGQYFEWFVRGYRFRNRLNGPSIIYNPTLGAENQYYEWDVRMDSAGTPLDPDMVITPPDFLDEYTAVELGSVPSGWVNPWEPVTPEPSPEAKVAAKRTRSKA